MANRLTKDETGHRYGQWLVLGRAPSPRQSGGAYWLCRCTCGREASVFGGNLRSRNSTGCGCQQKQKAKRTALAHGREPFMLAIGGTSPDTVRKQVQTMRSKRMKVSLAPVRWPEERD